jgi:O-antigen ligase
MGDCRWEIRDMREERYKNLLWYGVAAILIFAPLARGAVRIWSFTPIMFVIFFLTFIWLWKFNNLQIRFKPTSLDKPILIFFVIAVISVVFSIYKQASLYALLQLISFVALYYLIVNSFDYVMARRLVGFTVCVGVVISIYGLLQYFDICFHPWWAHGDFLSATYVNHNHFSGYLELLIPVTIGFLLSRRERVFIKKIGLAVALIILIAAFVVAQSRGAWICLAASLFFMSVILMRKKRANKTAVFAVILFIPLIVLFVYLVKPEISRRFDTVANMETGDASFQTRLKIWQGTIEMIKHNPRIGSGIGSYVWAFPNFKPPKLDKKAHFAHNDYLHITSEMGILAFAVMVWILIVLIKKGLRIRNQSMLVLGCGTGILSLSLHGIVDFNFHIPANVLLFTVFAAFIMRGRE